MAEDDIYMKDGTVYYKNNLTNKKKTGTWKEMNAVKGRYWTIACFSIIMGMTLLTLPASIPRIKPTCYGNDTCDPTFRHSAVCFLIAMGDCRNKALGIGGIKPCVSSFGADDDAD
ncbi:protein NRT1/ PTR FAMILY 8.2-like [Cornus florida]|uniref:protein NRT1/ PTR FAMILY 8.2-like n=1 Tax=Cornus florida TaxID=4283 RepID=UPI0028997CF9|nr:protein NRT1/ PTR FAMILY 8.2-like [Cornus florida]